MLAWGCQTQKLQAPGRRRAERAAEHRRTGWYRQAKDNEARWEGPRKSHTLIVPRKQGNLYRGDPGDGKGGVRPGIVGRKLGGDSEPQTRVYVSLTDSEAGR